MNEFERLGVGILDPVKSPGTPHSERSTRFPLLSVFKYRSTARVVGFVQRSFIISLEP